MNTFVQPTLNKAARLGGNLTSGGCKEVALKSVKTPNIHLGSRFCEIKTMKKQILYACCALAATLLAGSAQAQLTWTNGGNLNTTAVYDGLGVNSAVNPLTCGSPGHLGDWYIGNGAVGTLYVKSGTLTINADDFKGAINGGTGSVVLAPSATLNINMIGSWSMSTDNYNDSTGILTISNNAVLNYFSDGEYEQRFGCGSGPNDHGTVNIYGGTFNLTETEPITDGNAGVFFGANGSNSLGTLNLNAGTFNDEMPLPLSLGGYYNGMPNTPTAVSEGLGVINILNGSLVMTEVCPTINASEATLTVNPGSYVNFISGGTGSLSLTNWQWTDYAALGGAGGLYVDGYPSTISNFKFSTNNGQGVLQVGTNLLIGAMASPSNFVYAGTAVTLGVSNIIGTPTAFQWQWDNGSDGAYFTNIAGATASNTVVNTSSLQGIYEYQLIADFAQSESVTSAIVTLTVNPASAPILVMDITPAGTNEVYAGYSFSMSASFTGLLPITNQWQFSTNDVTWTNVPGATSTTLKFATVLLENSGFYRLVASNSLGWATSSTNDLVVATLTPSLVGEWLTGATNFNEVSGYAPTNTFNGFLVGGGHAVFTNDAPPGFPGQSLYLFNNDTGLGITNSSTVDHAYVSTFDQGIAPAFTVSCWARGLPGQWNSFVSKFGEGEAGWQLREDGSVSPPTFACFTVRDNSAGAGDGDFGGGDLDDMVTRSVPSNDGKWHNYTGTFNAATGIRNLWIDGTLAAQETGNTPYILAPAEHVCIGMKDQPPGDNYCCQSTFEIYGVRIYNYDLSSNEVQQLIAIPSNAPPYILQQPESASGTSGAYAFPGSSVVINANVVDGGAPLSYQWVFDGTNKLANGGAISGANSNTLTISHLSLADVGTYQLITTNKYGVQESTEFVIYNPEDSISWSAPNPITTPDVTLNQPGPVVYAATFGGTETLLTLNNGENYDFTTTNATATLDGTGGGGTGNDSSFVDGGTNADDVVWNGLMSSYLHANDYGGPFTITLTNLTPGVRYSVQLFALDDSSGNTIVEAIFNDAVDPADASAEIEMGQNVYIVGTFVAAGTTENIIEQTPSTGTGYINALVVRLGPPQVSIVNNLNGTVTVTWDQTSVGAHLYSASSLTGPWTDRGTSGTLTVATSATKAQFFKAEIP
jgi:hypothetical protein